MLQETIFYLTWGLETLWRYLKFFKLLFILKKVHIFDQFMFWSKEP